MQDKLMKKVLGIVLILLLFPLSVGAVDLYVATDGDDSHTYAQAQNIGTPWLTIDHGADNMLAGDTVHVRSGTYAEAVTIGSGGSIGSYKTIRNYASDSTLPILDGEDTRARGIDFAHNVSYVKIIGFEVKDFTQYGITNWYSNLNNYIEISDSKVHDNGSAGANYAGIAFYGDAGGASDYITIDNCEIYNNEGNGPGGPGVMIYRYSVPTFTDNLVYMNPPEPKAASEFYQISIAHMGATGDLTDLTFTGNYIYFGMKSVRIWYDGVNTGTNLVSNNVFAYAGFCGLDIHDDWDYDILVKNNIFAYNMTLGCNPKYADETDFYNNVFYENGLAGFEIIIDADYTNWENNILYGGQYGMYIYDSANHIGTYDYNDYYDNADYNIRQEYPYPDPNPRVIGANSITEDPQFTDPPNFDFTTSNANLNNTGNNPSGDCDEIGLCSNFVNNNKIPSYRALTVDSSSYDAGTPARTVDLLTHTATYMWAADDDQAWVIYDCGGTVTVRFIGIRGNHLSMNSWPAAFRVLVSTTDTQAGSFSQVLSKTIPNLDNGLRGAWYDLGPTYQAKYIKLIIDSTRGGAGSNATIAEFYAVGPLGAGITAALTGTLSDGATEAQIVGGGETLIITLTSDTWVATVGADNAITTALIVGIDSGGAEAAGWDAEVRGDGTNKLTHAEVVRTSNTIVTITLTAKAAYAITTNETVTATIPATALTESSSAIVATPTFEITATAMPAAALTGTLSDNATEAQIVAGGETVLITLTNDTWVAAGATFDGQRQNIINGMDSAQSEGTGWDAEVKAKEVVTAVVRTNDTVVTITLTAAAAYDISANESVTVTVPASALVTSGDAVVATPQFSLIFFDTSTEEIRGMTLQ